MRKGGLSYLGEVKSAGLSTGSTPGGHTDGAAGPEKGAVDLPGAETGAQTPDMLGRDRVRSNNGIDSTYVEGEAGEVHGSTEGQEGGKECCEEEITAGPGAERLVGRGGGEPGAYLVPWKHL